MLKNLQGEFFKFCAPKIFQVDVKLRQNSRAARAKIGRTV